jgi:putative DNA primase/helicase
MTDRVDDALEIARLAALDPVSYERERQAAADKLGIRVAALDRFVAAARGAGENRAGQGRPLVFPEVDRANGPVDGAELLDELVMTLRRHVVMSSAAAAAISLWVVLAWVFERVMVTPRLLLKSSEKRAGKTTTLMLLGELVPRPLFTANTTPAAVYRAVEMARPTFLIDEADRFFKRNPELLGLLNAGYIRGGQVLRLVGEDHDPRQFGCWCPVAMAAIGHFDPTLEDRAVAVGLKRRRRDEPIAPLEIEALAALAPLRGRIARWADDHAAAIGSRRPARVDGLHDRAFDCWKGLLALADEAGGGWPQRAREVAVALAANEDAESRATLLLRDIRDLFTARGAGMLWSQEIVADLLAREEHGWAEMGRSGKPLSVMRLASLLRPYGIAPAVHWRGTTSAKGYLASQFEDAWGRYL